MAINMVIALVGSQGTGKTTVFEELKKQKPEWVYFSEGVRHQSSAFGYGDPEAFCSEYGVGIFELMNMNAWSVIDPVHNSALTPGAVVVCDRSAIDNYAYYLALRNTQEDFKIESVLAGMARYYASLIDYFIFFPLNVIPLVADDMRKESEEYQMKVDEGIQEGFELFHISPHKIHRLNTTTIKERVTEIVDIISQ